MFDGMMDDMPEDRPAPQVSKSAEQVADAVSGTELATVEETAGGPRLYICGVLVRSELGNSFNDRFYAMAAEINKRVSSQTASAASPVAGVSGEKLDMFAAYVVNNDGEPGDCLECYRKEHVDALLEKLAQPSAEGDGELAHIAYLGMKAEVDALREYLGAPTCYPRTDWTRTLVDEVKARMAAEGDGWIAVTERLPQYGKPVLVYSKYWSANPFVARLHRGKWEGENILSRPDSVTHWRPLPTPPSVQEEKGSSE